MVIYGSTYVEVGMSMRKKIRKRARGPPDPTMLDASLSGTFSRVGFLGRRYYKEG